MTFLQLFIQIDHRPRDRRGPGAAAVLAALCEIAASTAASATASPESSLHAKHGAVASDSSLASAAGLEILRAGGNAVDAACATTLALGVVDPFASGLGGGGFALVYLAKTGANTALDFRETAPAALAIPPTGGLVIPPQSGLSIGVPGEARGLAELVRRFGTLPFSRCVEPALRLARGFAVSPRLARLIEEEIKRNPTSGPELIAKIFSLDKLAVASLHAGERVARPMLARSLERLRREGADALYRGEIAADIVAAARAAGSPLSLDDLASYAPVERKPIETNFLGRRVLLMPPPSAGGVILAEAMDLLSNRLTDIDRSQGRLAPACLHLVAEALKHGFADRARFLGDPAFTRLPLDHLLDPAYHRELALRTHLDRVLQHEAYGTPSPLPTQPARDAGTAHVSVVDKFGNAVALTTTINLEFGARIVAGRTGIVLNDELDDFTATAGTTGHSDIFAVAGSAANQPAPGKRPASSMSPTIVLGERGVELVTGAAGGPRIVSTTLQILLDALVFASGAGQAVARPRIHHQWEPNQLFYEPGLPAGTLDALKRLGQSPKEKADMAKANAILRTKTGWEAAADPRSGGAPAGY